MSSRRFTPPIYCAKLTVMTYATEVPHSPLHEKLGIEIIQASSHEVIGTMPVPGNTQPAGVLHGGATAALVEGLASIAASMHAQPERIAVGVDLNVTHLRPAISGKVTGKTTPVRLGRRTTVHTVEIYDSTGELIAVGRLTCQLIAPRGQDSLAHDRPRLQER